MTPYEDKAASIIAKYEGFRSEAYQDQGGVWTIGYGFTEGVKKGQKMGAEEAHQRLRSEVSQYTRAVERYATNPNLTEDQRASLTSFAYNVGIDAFRNSTLLAKVNSGDIKGAEKEFGRWTNVKGRFNKGLFNRRMQELALFSGKDTQGIGPDDGNVISMAERRNRSSTEAGISSGGTADENARAILARTQALAADLQASTSYDDSFSRWIDRVRQEGRGA